ncbi:Na(+)-translocating NADH-quinone reductase subunit C [Sungkyunkwania multivorans]|uniref:Na(+)-translocating NADH-quinone reductase subunit C n=1 Tax=Sungkyunkwania multivorans TaxID=1173618 RepID=A0ABW3D056_9FLAO
MALNTDKNSYTVIFAIAMVVVVGAILASMAGGLKPMIKENERLEKQQNILYAMGVNDNGDDKGAINFVPTEEVAEVFAKYITKQLVIVNGEVVHAVEGDEIVKNSEEDGLKGLKDIYLIDIKKEADKAKDPSYSRKLPLFVGEKDGKTLYVVPMRGKGLWDAIWGYAALDKDMVVQGVFFDHKGETPGLGANIKARFFMDDFKGEALYAGNAFNGITVAKGNADPLNKIKDDNEVDALAGATITGDGVTAMIKKDLSMYLSYFENLK